ncbi:hypothetical protein [Rhizohabitans arisaemae]|uniref:hypothetical protein n=1 Tax=Rhizohabitans arisaemae TaxID=2720610 RepID=UPI0024B05CB5|nr:hypothetical protein [Rhizohabitans arisaemae]
MPLVLTVIRGRFRTPRRGPGTRPDASLLTGRWLVSCVKRCLSPKGYSRETRLTPASFDMRQAPRLTEIGPPGFFLGDYAGLTHDGRDFVTAFSRPHDDDRAAVFSVRVRPVGK